MSKTVCPNCLGTGEDIDFARKKAKVCNTCKGEKEVESIIADAFLNSNVPQLNEIDY